MTRYVKDSEWGVVFPNFRKEEFMCNHKSVGDGIYYSLVEVMQNLRNKYGSITLSCGYRCPVCNAQVGGDPNSAHLLGAAADFRLDSGYQDNLENRKKLVTELRQTYNVHYAYCKVDDNHIWDGYTLINARCNMGVYIHVDTNPGYYPVPIGLFEAEEVGIDYVKVKFLPSNYDNNAYDWAMFSLNDYDFQNLPTSNVINELEPDTVYKLQIKCRVTDTPLWVESDEIYFTTKSEDIPEIIPDKKDEPTKETSEEVFVRKYNIIDIIVNFIKELIEKFLGE